MTLQCNNTLSLYLWLLITLLVLTVCMCFWECISLTEWQCLYFVPLSRSREKEWWDEREKMSPFFQPHKILLGQNKYEELLVWDKYSHVSSEHPAPEPNLKPLNALWERKREGWGERMRGGGRGWTYMKRSNKERTRKRKERWQMTLQKLTNRAVRMDSGKSFKKIMVLPMYYVHAIFFGYIPWEWHSSLNLPYCKGTNNKKGTEIVRDRKIKRGGAMKTGPPLIQFTTLAINHIHGVLWHPGLSTLCDGYQILL